MSRPCFFSRGLITASFRSNGTDPLLNDSLVMLVISRVKLLDDPEKIARKRFMAFLSSLRSIVKHTKSRHHSDHQKVFKLDFKKRWPPIKKDSLYICISVDSNSLRPVYMLQLFIFINIFIQLQFVILIKVYDYIENKIMT